MGRKNIYPLMPKIMGIYMITNMLTNESYVGKSIDVYKRFRNHCSKSSIAKSKLSYDIDKYGKDNFKLTLLKVFGNEYEFYLGNFYYERYYMAVYRPAYNIAFGDSGGHKDGLDISDSDYVKKARTNFNVLADRFLKKYQTLESYTAAHHPNSASYKLKELRKNGY